MIPPGGSPRHACRKACTSATSLIMGAAVPDPSVRLITEIARGDRDAFAHFYDLHAALVHTFARRILREHGEAEEVVQDVFVQVWRQAETYSTERGTPEAWLIKMTRSRGIDKLRSRRRRDEMVRPADDPGSAARARRAGKRVRPGGGARDPRRGARRPAVGPAERPRARVLRRTSRRAEIAARLGEPLGTVKTRMRSGLERLRGILATRSGAETGMNHDQWLEQTDVYAVGALDGRELAEFEAHLAHGVRDLRRAAPRDSRGADALRGRCRRCRCRPRSARASSRRSPRALAGDRAGGAPTLAAPPGPRHLVGRLGRARGGRRTPGRRERASSARRGRSSAPCRTAWRRSRRSSAEREDGGAVPVGPERPLREPGRTQAHAGRERVAPVEPDDAAGSAPRARPARRSGGARLRALGARGLPARAGGLFSVDAAGRALLRLPPLPEGHTYDAFAVTLEPAPGVPKPTGPMHLHGKVL